MGYLILALLSIVGDIGWLTGRISTIALLEWIAKKGYEPPTEQELNDCVRSAVHETFGLK